MYCMCGGEIWECFLGNSPQDPVALFGSLSAAPKGEGHQHVLCDWGADRGGSRSGVKIQAAESLYEGHRGKGGGVVVFTS